MLERAISNVTRLLAEATDPDSAAELVKERREMREELRALVKRAADNVVSIESAKRRDRG